MEKQTFSDVQDNVTRMIVNNDLQTYAHWTRSADAKVIHPNADERAFAKRLYINRPRPVYKSRKQKTPEDIAREENERYNDWARTTQQNTGRPKAASHSPAEYNKRAAKNALWHWQAGKGAPLHVQVRMLAWECQKCKTLVRGEDTLVCTNTTCNTYNPNPEHWTLINPGSSSVQNWAELPTLVDGTWVMNGKVLAMSPLF
jgi:hypothetical protein